MDIFKFMSDSPVLTFCIVYMVTITFYNTVSIVYGRTIRYLNIRKHGYPPEHCDADGNFKPTPKKCRRVNKVK